MPRRKTAPKPAPQAEPDKPAEPKPGELWEHEITAPVRWELEPRPNSRSIGQELKRI